MNQDNLVSKKKSVFETGIITKIVGSANKEKEMRLKEILHLPRPRRETREESRSKTKFFFFFFFKKEKIWLLGIGYGENKEGLDLAIYVFYKNIEIKKVR